MVLDYRYKLSQSHFILLMALGFKIHEFLLYIRIKVVMGLQNWTKTGLDRKYGIILLTIEHLTLRETTI